MKKEKKLNQEKRFAGIIKIFITVCFWACLFAAALCAVLGIVFIIFPDVYSFFVKPHEIFSNLPYVMKANETVGIGLSDMLEYYVKPDTFPAMDMKSVYEVLLFRMAICQSLLVIFFYQLLQVLKCIKVAQPFVVKNSERITIMGILLIIYSIVVRIGDYIILRLTLEKIAMPELTLKFSFSWGGILIGLLLILLAGIFRYGGYLQEEYDTTL